MKKIILGLLLAAVALPAMALTESQAEATGIRWGRLVCRAIADGVPSKIEIGVYQAKHGSDTDFEEMKILNESGGKSPLFAAFIRGQEKTIKPCKEAYDDLPVK